MASNKLKTIAIICLLFSITETLFAQFPGKYWVKFTDKNGSPYSVSNPSAYLSAKSIARRANQGISVNMTDIPVNQTYINQVNATGATVFQRSKWFNAAIVIVNNASQLNAINSLTCVIGSSIVGRYFSTTTADPLKPLKNTYRTANVTSYNYGPSITQISQIGVDCMHDLGYRGQNMMIAVIDAGFDNANANPVFDSLFNEGRLLGTRDYVAGNTSVYEDYLHGANCLSLMAGNSPGNLIGTGPKASYWLLRTEDVGSEKPIEESNWVIAAEFADSVGADITTTSLGYTEFANGFESQSHVYSDLNGRTAVMSIAATMAVRKGLFVLNAAGNDGNNGWHFIGVAGDADSICTVGSVNGGGVHSGFSSVGPTSDGRIKPDLSTMGENSYVCSPNGSFGTGSGTSYATPILAGAVACLWQAHPNRTNMEIMQALKATSSRSSSPDNNYGWGIPNMCAAHNYLNLFTGVNDRKNNSFKLFPNPAHSELNFNLSEAPKEILITDVIGKTVSYILTNNGAGLYTLNFNDGVANGIYFISIETSEGKVNSRFVKE